jgi:RHS repeat-associated protein
MEFDIINMNGRLYDPVLGRFFSPDNYVQMPDNSQNFNRYNYCLNNPLKYTDPSGNLFGIDDAVITFAVFNMASSMMPAAYNGESVWKAGGLSLLSSSSSYGIGAAFGSAGSFGKEMLRAGSHGLASGVVSALDGGNFASAFVSDAAASGIGSYAKTIKGLETWQMVSSTAAMGGVVAWATGGDFLQGAMQGMSIGIFNHAMHDGNNDDKPYKVLPDGTVELDEIEVIGHKSNGLVPFRSEDVCVTFDRGADHPIALSLSVYLNSISVANGSRAIDINYINRQHVSPQNAYARYLQNLIRNTPGYLENYGPFIINKVVKGKVIPAPWARKIRGGHYDHVHISMPK